MLSIFDTHAHYDDESFDGDRESVLAELAGQGVDRVVNVGANMEGSRASLRLAGQYSFIYAALGVHPSETASMTEADIGWIRGHAHDEKVVAVGEIGLDYHWPEPSPEIQKQWFRRQIALAREVSLPIIVHSRDAAADTMDILTGENAAECGGVIHCYSYSPEMAKEYVRMGFYIGIGGVVTFKNAKKLVRTTEEIPLNHIVLETDCPYLAPEPNRGTRNDSGMLRHVVQKIAELKGIRPEEVIRATTENAERLYRLRRA